MLSRLFVLAAFAAAAATAAAQPAEWWGRSTHGFRSSPNVAKVAPEAAARELKKGPSGPAEAAAVEVLERAAGHAFKDSAARLVMVARGDRVIFDDRAWTVMRPAPLGFSMSKSLTAMAVGKALCNGQVHSLDDPVGQYLPRLAATSWGRATVRQALTMTTGALWTVPTGWRDRATSELHSTTYDGQHAADYVDLMLAADDRVGDPGGHFRYSNYDTIALALLVESATGERFPEFFGREIWAQAGTEKDGAWLRTRSGQTVAYAGFSATPEDWIRLGLYVLDAREHDTCFGRFMREATSRQVEANFFSHAYGYQTWTGCAPGTDAFCFYGFGGQLLIMSPAKRLVLYAHSTSAAHSVDWHWLEAFSSAWSRLEAAGAAPPERAQ